MIDRDWNILVKSIHQGNCILMLGPEIAVEKSKGAAKPLLQILANELADELGNGSQIVDRNNLAQIAQRYCSKESVSDLQYVTEDFFEKRHKLQCEVHSALASMPFHLIINATPDCLFVEALKANKKTPEIDWYNFRRGVREIEVKGTTDKPFVYYLYGHTKDPDSLVLSENDLLDFLVSVISKTPPIPTYLSSEFSDKNNNFLFLGFGFRNWYLRILLHVLQAGNRMGRSFALEELVDEKDSHFQNAVVFFQNEYKIKFFNEKLGNFVKELKKKYNEEVGDQPAPVADAPAHAPSVFICHASEDKSFAKKLFDNFKAGGLDPWLDKEKIRGGDEWDDLIEDTIETVDYFVVVQSKAMEAKIEGYVNKEINIALKNRQSKVRKPYKFTVPIKIDDCEPLDDLKNLQTIDFTKEDKMDELISTIRRDRQRRNKR